MRQKKHVRGYRTDSEMYAHIRAWEASGQTQQAYVLAQGLPKSVFRYWLRRYRQEKQGGFVEVSPVAESVPVLRDETTASILFRGYSGDFHHVLHPI